MLSHNNGLTIPGQAAQIYRLDANYWRRSCSQLNRAAYCARGCLLRMAIVSGFAVRRRRTGRPARPTAPVRSLGLCFWLVVCIPLLDLSLISSERFLSHL
jgi:hypothetical protein